MNFVCEKSPLLPSLLIQLIVCRISDVPIFILNSQKPDVGKDTNSKTLSIVFANLVYTLQRTRPTKNQGRSRLDMCEISYLLPLV